MTRQQPLEPQPTYEIPEGGTKRRPWDVPPGLAAVLAAIIAVGGGLAGRALAPNNSPSPAPTVTTTITAPPSPSVPAAHLEFSLTDGTAVPFCQVYNGTGAIPAGYSLLIFDTPAGFNGQLPSTPYFSFDKRASPTGDHWQTEPLQIGTRGQAKDHVDIVGVLASNDVYQYISSIQAKNDVFWISGALPPGPTIKLAVVTNGKNGLSCH